MDLLWLGAIGITGAIVALVVVATIVTFAAKSRD